MTIEQIAGGKSMATITELQEIELDIKKAELKRLNLENVQQRCINELLQLDINDRANDVAKDENEQPNLEEN